MIMVYSFKVVLRSLTTGEMITRRVSREAPGKPDAWERVIAVNTRITNHELMSVQYEGGVPSEWERVFMDS